MRTINTDTLIIGAGPAGLACARELARAGKDFVIVEVAGCVGGLAKTLVFEEDGLVFRTDLGPHRFFSKNPHLYSCIEEILHEKWITVSRHTRQYIGGKFYRYPVQFFEALGNIGILRAIRMAFDYGIAKILYGFFGKKIQNFADYVYATFGRSLGEFNMINYTEKIWGIPAREIHQDWAGQRIKGLNVRELLKHAVLNHVRGSGGSDLPKTLVDSFYYPSLGTGLIYETIAHELVTQGYQFFLRSSPRLVEFVGRRCVRAEIVQHGGEVIALQFNNLVESVPLPQFVSLLHPQPPEDILAHARMLRFRSQVYVFLTLDRETVTPDQWIYFPDKEIPIGRMSEMRNFSPLMSPPGKTSLMVEFFCFEGDEVWTMSDESHAEKAVSWLVRMQFIARDEVRRTYVIRQKDVYPLYDLRYREHVGAIKRWIDGFDNLYCIGRPGRFRYNNQDHSLEMGFAVARSVVHGVREDIEKIGEEKEYYESGNHRQSSGSR